MTQKKNKSSLHFRTMKMTHFNENSKNWKETQKYWSCDI